MKIVSISFDVDDESDDSFDIEFLGKKIASKLEFEENEDLFDLDDESISEALLDEIGQIKKFENQDGQEITITEDSITIEGERLESLKQSIDEILQGEAKVEYEQEKHYGVEFQSLQEIFSQDLESVIGDIESSIIVKGEDDIVLIEKEEKQFLVKGDKENLEVLD